MVKHIAIGNDPILPDCDFCSLPTEREISRTELLSVVRAHSPIQVLHTLVIPRVHQESIFNLDPVSYAALFERVKVEAEAIRLLDDSVTGFNVGINQGSSAGQTVMHAHLHIIPRRPGDEDVTDRTPEKPKYWELD